MNTKVNESKPVEYGAYSSTDDQAKEWKGFAYVKEANIVINANGEIFNPDQFKNYYGGRIFMLDFDGKETKPTKNAFEAFTQSLYVRHPKVDRMAFRPDLPTDKSWENEGKSYVNTYRKINVKRVVGDSSLFTNHLAKLLPNERDREIMLSYMAGVVQYPGKKFQWAPMIQGCEGNGKSLLSEFVANAVGLEYTHSAKASQIAEKFNSWQLNKIFIAVEDVFTPNDKAEIFETLKPMITQSRQPIRAMQMAERTMDVCANWILNSNHQDGVRKTGNDRRICPLFCAQQSKEDLIRDGMDDEYFSTLYNWVRKGDGFAIVSELLHTYEISEEFGLKCLLSRAPDTTSTEMAVAIGFGQIEQEIMECIEQGNPGFRGGWIDGNILNSLLESKRMDKSIPRNKRRAMLKTLGYNWHPELHEGRSSASIGGTKPILYIKDGHPALQLKDGPSIKKAYLDAQQYEGNVKFVSVSDTGTENPFLNEGSK